MFNLQVFNWKTILQLCCCLATIAHMGSLAGRVRNRIAGGFARNIGTAPYLVQVRTNTTFICAGTLVSEFHVITAAHCVVRKDPLSLNVMGGTSVLGVNGPTVNVTSIFIPQQYNPRTLNMDVAVVKLSSSLNGTNIAEISLCNTKWMTGTFVKISGWGRPSRMARKLLGRLRTVQMPVMAFGKCKDFHKRQRVNSNMFCAATYNNRGFCDGDGGGPAVYADRLCGVMSWNKGCGNPKFPDVFVNVNRAKQFIINAMRN